MTETPPLLGTLRDGFHFFYPLVIVTVLLLLNYSPPLVGAVGCAIVVLTGALRRRTRVNFRTNSRQPQTRRVDGASYLRRLCDRRHCRRRHRTNQDWPSVHRVGRGARWRRVVAGAGTHRCSGTHPRHGASGDGSLHRLVDHGRARSQRPGTSTGRRPHDHLLALANVECHSADCAPRRSQERASPALVPCAPRWKRSSSPPAFSSSP